eukprot:SAG31_NODE_1770_length_7309_cov_56.975867_2_plen_62_part_00
MGAPRDRARQRGAPEAASDLSAERPWAAPCAAGGSVARDRPARGWRHAVRFTALEATAPGV